MLIDALLSATPTALGKVLDGVLADLRPYQWHAFNTAVVCAAVWTLLRWLRTSRLQPRTTQLRGPPSVSFVYGVGKHVLDAEDPGAVYEAWAQEYGPAYAVPSTLWTKRIVLCDPKAIAHFYAKDTWAYVLTPMTKTRRAHFVRAWCRPSRCTVLLTLGISLGKGCYGPMARIIRGTFILWLDPRRSNNQFYQTTQVADPCVQYQRYSAVDADFLWLCIQGQITIACIVDPISPACQGERSLGCDHRGEQWGQRSD